MANENNNSIQPVIDLVAEKAKWKAEQEAQVAEAQRIKDLDEREQALTTAETTAKWNARLPKAKQSYIAKGGKVGKDDADFKAWANANKDAIMESDDDKIESVVIGSYKTHGVYFNLDENGEAITATDEFTESVKHKNAKGERSYRRVPGTTTRIG